MAKFTKVNSILCIVEIPKTVACELMKEVLFIIYY